MAKYCPAVEVGSTFIGIVEKIVKTISLRNDMTIK
jgi:hypothetical protein